MAARAIGLDCGPMSGLDNEAVDGEFFPGGQIKSNFICAIGYGIRRDCLSVCRVRIPTRCARSCNRSVCSAIAAAMQTPLSLAMVLKEARSAMARDMRARFLISTFRRQGSDPVAPTGLYCQVRRGAAKSGSAGVTIPRRATAQSSTAVGEEKVNLASVRYWYGSEAAGATLQRSAVGRQHRTRRRQC
jgi:hypothetical protein